MVNTLFLPELREMLAEHNEAELREFCEALHPSRTADFMDGLEPGEAWQILKFTELDRAVEIFGYFEHPFQTAIIESQDRDEVAKLIAKVSSDDRVDILADVDPAIVEELLSRLSAEDRRDIMRLSQYPEGTAGAIMATEFVKLPENLTIAEAIKEVGRQTERYETIYYIYIVDQDNHLRGLVSARQLLTGMRRPDTKLSEIMETALITADAMEDRSDVVDKVARMDLLAIPVVDKENHIVGIITHDDVIDAVREEAQDDQLRSAGVAPLEDTYMNTSVLLLSWKRGMWLMILFFCAHLTATALHLYEHSLEKWAWLIPFIPLIISSGGNSGSQSATLVITALAHDQISIQDWLRIVLREIAMGFLLGIGLALISLVTVMLFFPNVPGAKQAFIVPISLVLVVVSGTVIGSMLPLIFKRFGLDPALMSNPFVAGIIDILGIVIYMTVASAFLE
ncbi:MAG: magnesium transporter [Pirellulaceae bacterium]